MQIKKNGRDAAKTRLFGNDPGKCMMNKAFSCIWVKFETDVLARKVQ